MGGKDGSDYRYNGQISVDQDNQIIVEQHVSQKSNDKQEVESALERIRETTGQLPEKMSLDNSYMSRDNLEALEGMEVDDYIATDRSEKLGKSDLDESTHKLVKADFKYTASENFFTCPVGQKLPLVKRHNSTFIYQGGASVCDQCPYKSRCCQSKKGEARTITTDDKEEIRGRMNEKMAKETSKEIHKARKIIVEPVFGQIKNSGFRGFSVRGKDKVAGEFSLV
ncbi:MAG: transposase [Oleiphilaceae bacterium]|jgi:transposase